MKKFLAVFAEYIYEKYGDSLLNCCVVFPNKRAGVYLLHYLQQAVKAPVISPAIYSIAEFYALYSPLAIPGTLEQLIHLYLSHKNISNSKESFEQFYGWGKTLLNDFNDVDKQMVDARQLFQNIASLKELDQKFDYLDEDLKEYIRLFWSSFVGNQATEEQKQFSQIWEMLYPIYKDFKERLKKENLAYEGMLARELAEKAINDEINWRFDKIFIVGLNALTQCDELIFKKLQKQEKIEFFWDYDNYYVKNTMHKAGEFIRKNQQQFPETPLPLSKNSFTEKPKKVSFYSCNSTMLQVKILSEIVSSSQASSTADTVIVPADDNLLLPLLHNPPKSKSCNFSIGFPMLFSPVFTLVEALSLLQQNIAKKKNETYFYKSDVLAVLQHPYCTYFRELDDLSRSIKAEKFETISSFKLHKNELTKNIFQAIKTNREPDYVAAIFSIIFKNLTHSAEDASWIMINKEYLFHANKLLEKTSQQLSTHKLKFSTKEFFSIYLRGLRETRVPFQGNHTDELQVMGLLETRLLDFSQVIILSANDDILPGKSHNRSFIPYHLRKGFGIPTTENHDNIISYYFYRLLQHAEKVDLFYVSHSQNLGSSEPSRFLQQLKFESPFFIEEKVVANLPQYVERKEIRVERDQCLQQKVLAYLKSKVSASALNTYLDCQLKFYFQYIKKIKEPEDVVKSDNLILGNWFHVAANMLYLPFLGKEISKENIASLQTNSLKIKGLVEKSFAQIGEINPPKRALIANKYLLLAEIVEKYLHQLLRFDRQLTPFKLLYLEKEIVVPFVIDEDKNVVIQLKGLLDRVDESDGKLRLIDYKTGKVENTFPSFYSLFDTSTEKRYKTPLQLLFYSLLYAEKYPATSSIIPTVYPLPTLYEPKDTFLYQKQERGKLKIDNFGNVKSEFQTKLGEFLLELMDREQAFVQTTDKDICKFCPYNSICCVDLMV